MKRIAAAFVIAVGVMIPTSVQAASADPTTLLISGGPYEGTRSSDGTSTLSISASNLTDKIVEVGLQANDCSPSPSVGKPQLMPFTTTKVTFTMSCLSGAGPRTGKVTGQIVNTDSTLTPSEIVLQFTLSAKEASEWSVLWWFLLAGVLLSCAAVIPPFLFWVRWPQGNAKSAKAKERKEASDRAAAEAKARDSDAQDVVAAADAAAAGAVTTRGSWGQVKKGWRRELVKTLPGITQDWSLNGNWASNVSLAAAVFTGVFATNANILEGLVGKDATGTLTLIAVAAALCAGAIGTGPLWLTIFKERLAIDDGLAKHNTVVGVLVASFFVLFGSTGLVVVVAIVLGRGAVWGLAIVTLGVLLLYSWKSIPQTLALGAKAPPPAEGAGSAPITVETTAML